MNREQFDTEDEYYFALWLEELKEAGYVDYWEWEPPPFKLTSGLTIDYEEVIQLKTKTKYVEKVQTLLKPSIYTPDFKIYWHPISEGLFYEKILDGSKLTKPFLNSTDKLSFVELKPGWDSGNMTRLFVLNQKFVWDRFGIFINLIDDLKGLFAATFTPYEYTITPKKKQQRKLNYTVRTLKEFLDAK